MQKILIVSLGGSPEPVLHSIREHRPELVYFVASSDSVEGVSSIKETLKKEGLGFTNRNVILKNHEILESCYSQLKEELDQIDQDRKKESNVVLDYTGGTKTMSAAMVLAGAGRHYGYSYVGGNVRDKEGLGVVITDSEKLWTWQDPRDTLAVEERKLLALYINGYQYEAALEVVKALNEYANSDERKLFDHLTHLLEGYKFWDRFDHRMAIRHLSEGLKIFNFLPSLDENLQSFLNSVEENFCFLKRVVDETQRKQEPKSPGPNLIVDLLSNARRRAKEGKYDDAVARLYRSVEMIGQQAFKEHFNCLTNNVQTERLPKSLQVDYKKNYTDSRDGRVKIGLKATFSALAAKEVDIGIKFQEAMQLQNCLELRNNSILAHGTQPVEQQAYTKLEQALESFYPVCEYVCFAQLDW